MKLFEKIKKYFRELREYDVDEDVYDPSDCKIFYICDRKACKKCAYPECKHTTNIYHARNFERIDDIFVEGTIEEK